jgi:hypothetical protein
LPDRGVRGDDDGVRAVYAVSFTLPEGTGPDEVLDCAGSWFCRGQAPAEVRTSWEVGRRSYPLPVEGHTLEVEVFESDEGRLWQGTWRHPHAQDSDLHLISDAEVGVTKAGTVTLSLVIRVVWARPKVAPPRFDMRAPRLARDVVERFEVSDGRHRLTSASQVLDAASVPAFIEDVLLDPERTRPVVFVSDDPRKMGPNIEPDGLARQLAGLAHVYTSLYGRPGWELERRLGPFGCRDGAVRVWWPGLAPATDSPYGHMLLTGYALRRWQGPPADVLLFRRISTAAAMNAAPPSHPRLRRAGRLAQAASATDAELHNLLGDALDDNERLTDELKAEREQRDERELELELEREELAERLRASEEEKELIRRSYAEALAAAGAEPPPAPAAEVEEEREARSVREAVDVGVPQCPHLAFADSAFDSADHSPFKRPELVLDALQKLERLAALWARPGGIGGSDLGQMATELGLDWVGFVAPTTLTRYGRRYTFMWNGEKRTMGPHVRLGSGHGAGNIARIYLDRWEPDRAEDRRLVVAHVGRKLPDTTTG